MSNSKKVQEEDLKKLEDEAYFELCQIIAEAMELQDVDLLNARIASWKNKYKKLLDRPATNSRSDFKKRIEFLLTQYYSEVTKYILNQLKLNEEKKVANQAKALRELYAIIRDTNDYDLLKKKVNKWKEKYPVSGFLKMYQKRIELYSRDKNLRENAFKQEEAFSDLVDITKIHGTLDELKNELALWEEKYSINDKYTIDDFIKHQTEVKRFTSDEFLQSIAREEFNPDNIDKTEIDIVDEYNNKSFSNLSVQASSYAALLKISKSPNAVNEMFTWVYKNSNIKFNDKYKELILSATYLNYSPAYLNKLKKPKIDMSKSSLSFDEYANIHDIKKYAIISYFNLLLPPEKAIANDYFNKHIQTIYAKSERARVTDIKDEPTPIEQVLNSGIEISLKESIQENTIPYSSENDFIPTKSLTDKDSINATNEFSEARIITDSQVEPIVSLESSENETDSNKETLQVESLENPELLSTESELSFHLESSKESSNKVEKTVDKEDQISKPLDHNTIIAFSPLFFETIYNYNKQAVLVSHIDSTTTKYVEAEKTKEVSLDEPTKTKIDEE